MFRKQKGHKNKTPEEKEVGFEVLFGNEPHITAEQIKQAHETKKAFQKLPEFQKGDIKSRYSSRTC